MNSTLKTLPAYKNKSVVWAIALVTATLMAGCSSVKSPPKEYSQERLDEQIRVPPGHVVALETTATGLLNYECKVNANNSGAIGWALVGAQADLVDRTGKQVAKYANPPPTWMYQDGSTVTGQQIAVAPRLGATNLPYQLLKGIPGNGAGVLQNITYIQRIKTKGGQDLSKACGQADIGDKLTLPYQADYIFWKAA